MSPFSLRSRPGRVGALCNQSVAAILAVLMVSLSEAPALVASPEQSREQNIEKWKQEIRLQGVGEESRWEVRHRVGQKIRTNRGYVSEIRDEGFTLVESNGKKRAEIAFSDLESLKHWKPSSRALKYALLGGLVAGAVIVIGIFITLNNN